MRCRFVAIILTLMLNNFIFSVFCASIQFVWSNFLSKYSDASCICLYAYMLLSNSVKYYAIQGQFTVTDFGTNRKLICNFLLLINTNLLSCTVSKLWPIIGQIFASDRGGASL